MGANPTATGRNTQTPIRIFILGARAESALPPHVYEQVCHLFPYTQFQFYFVGPQAALPTRPLPPRDGRPSTTPSSTETRSEGKLYDEKTPTQSTGTEARGRSESAGYGVPAYTVPVSSTLALTTLQSPYESIHDQFGPFDPYTDVFFAFCPGFGFPSPTAGRDALNPDGTPVLQAQVEWKETLQKVLTTKCPLFVTGFSPRDVERDVKSLDSVDGVKGEYDILLRPGENGFGSLKWEAGDFDPRVMVRVNWGVWAMRGKSYDVDSSIKAE
jgi:splicing suppressor protein 51